MSQDTATSLELARKVLRIEAAAILGLVDRLDGDFERALQLLFECRGRVIVTGMGKSGIICRKIAATLSSTGTAAFFLHPAEAIHGDLGAPGWKMVLCCLCGNKTIRLQSHPADRREGDRDHPARRDRRWRKRPTSRSTAGLPKKRAR